MPSNSVTPPHARRRGLRAGLLWSLCAPATLAAQGTAAPPAPAAGATWAVPDDAAIRALLQTRLGGRVVGAVVGVVEPAGRRVVAFGVSGAPDGRPLDGATVFQVGSVTKVFTGLLLADMAVRGELRLDDPAASLLPPGVTMPRRGRPITLIDLSKHLSGLPSMPTNFVLTARPNPYAAYGADSLHAFLNRYTPPREPGTQEYSNLGVALLGRLLARRAGAEYEALLRNRVTAPLGLSSTSITLAADQRRRLAPGHDRYRRPVETWELTALPASGSLRSTVDDLLRFLEYNLGRRHSPLDSAMRLQRVPGRSVGWGRSTLASEGVYGHEGGKEGYRSAVVFNPLTGTGVVVLMNTRSDESPMALARFLLRGGGELPAVRPVPRAPARATLPPARLDLLAGDYRMADGREVRVVRRGDHLLVDVVGDGVSVCVPSGALDCDVPTDDMALTFVADPARRVTGLLLRTGATEARAAHVTAAPGR